jgi:hypothetical protein
VVEGASERGSEGVSEWVTVIEGASETLLPLPLPLPLPADGSCAALQSFDRRCSAPKMVYLSTDLFACTTCYRSLLSLALYARSVLFRSLLLEIFGCVICKIASLLLRSVE